MGENARAAALALTVALAAAFCFCAAPRQTAAQEAPASPKEAPPAVSPAAGPAAAPQTPAPQTPAPQAPAPQTSAPPASEASAPPEKFELSVEAGGAAMVGSRTLAENLAEAKDLSKFAALAGTGGLADALAGPGPYTVFAPLDRAFLEAPKDTASLLGPAAFDPETPERARRIASYHIVAGRYPAAALLAAVRAGGGEAKLRTLSGDELRVRNAGVRLELIDGRGEAAAIIVSDAPQKNGVLHVLDGVLTPKS
ncbi:fasciclin domain-containing protein [Methylocella sp.]|uniref:fasciclin domain-containing protein n=1 Tax=Methylocella sp. TaxID=1978226 RepID=UPI00378368BE